MWDIVEQAGVSRPTHDGVVWGRRRIGDASVAAFASGTNRTRARHTADADLERIAAIVDVMTGALPGGLTAWVRQLVDQERDRRIGKYYPLRPATDAIEDFEMPNCIAAAKRLRDHSIDLPLVALLDAVVDELEVLR